jgi:hypothetical protein
MKRSVKAKTQRRVPRDLFAELNEGMEALSEARQGKQTLRTHAGEYKPSPTVTSPCGGPRIHPQSIEILP